MKTYLVYVQILTGGFEKGVRRIVRAELPEQAVDYAIMAESHSPETLEWDEHGALDMGGEFYYRSRGYQKVAEEDLPILGQYFNWFRCDPDELAECGNYRSVSHRNSCTEIKPRQKVRKVCCSCGSEDVTHDALVTWDKNTQEWRLCSLLDEATCNCCGNSNGAVITEVAEGLS